jgi:hypothetical protein
MAEYMVTLTIHAIRDGQNVAPDRKWDTQTFIITKNTPLVVAEGVIITDIELVEVRPQEIK